MSPGEFLRSRDLILVDIRPADERRSDAGFLPASLALPSSSWCSTTGPLAMLGSLAEVRGLVVHCASGRRSESARVAMSRLTALPIFNLDGGMLAWEAEGLPVCRDTHGPLESVDSLVDFRRHLVACVVAESAELALDRGTLPDPYRLLAECFRRAEASWDEPTVEGLHRVLDWCAITTFRAGGQLRAIADNLVRLFAILEALERRRRTRYAPEA